MVDLVMYDLKAEGLRPADINGLADPYLRVCADFQVEPAVSSVKYKTLSPSWVGEELRLSVPLSKSFGSVDALMAGAGAAARGCIAGVLPSLPRAVSDMGQNRYETYTKPAG